MSNSERITQSSLRWVNKNIMQEFLGVAVNGARQNRFIINIVDTNTRYLTLACQRVKLPGITTGTNDLKHFGELHKKIAANRTFGDATMEFILSESGKERDYFVNWMDETFDRTTNTAKFLEDYVKDIEILTLDLEGKTTGGVKLINAYPLNIGDIDYNMSQDNAIVLLPVTFTFYNLQEIKHT